MKAEPQTRLTLVRFEDNVRVRQLEFHRGRDVAHKIVDVQAVHDEKGKEGGDAPLV